jgi:hypothetical protein
LNEAWQSVSAELYRNASEKARAGQPGQARPAEARPGGSERKEGKEEEVVDAEVVDEEQRRAA